MEADGAEEGKESVGGMEDLEEGKGAGGTWDRKEESEIDVKYVGIKAS